LKRTKHAGPAASCVALCVTLIGCLPDLERGRYDAAIQVGPEIDPQHEEGNGALDDANPGRDGGGHPGGDEPCRWAAPSDAFAKKVRGPKALYTQKEGCLAALPELGLALRRVACDLTKREQDWKLIALASAAKDAPMRFQIRHMVTQRCLVPAGEGVGQPTLVPCDPMAGVQAWTRSWDPRHVYYEVRHAASGRCLSIGSDAHARAMVGPCEAPGLSREDALWIWQSWY
jgi:DNA-binding transcriptional LysR family regulator